MTLDEVMDFSSAKMFLRPFQYFVAPLAFSPSVSPSILSWLETSAPWKLVKTDFYEQFEFSLLDVKTPSAVIFLRDRLFLEDLRKQMEGLFRTQLSERVDVTAHKLVTGQHIQLHNDFIAGEETHRLLIQLNQGWKESDGGFLLFFNSTDPGDVHKVLKPISNSAVGFAISPESNHAVSTVYDGERFTLVYSFYGYRDNY
jgi:Rps23 Pro-64 3,4-dihydroxylase Tpa1-like proline 4-hydroxylase